MLIISVIIFNSNIIHADVDRDFSMAKYNNSFSGYFNDIDGVQFYLDDNGLVDDNSMEDLRFYLELYQSQLGIYRGNTLIGIEENELNNYKVVNFRIENSANTMALLDKNINLQGKSVLFFGVYNKKLNLTYYVQVPLTDINLDYIADNLNNTNNGYSAEEIEKREIAYISLNFDNRIKRSTKNDFETLDISSENTYDVYEKRSLEYVGEVIDIGDTLDELKEISHGSFIEEKRIPKSLINGIDDSVFKSGRFNTWKTKFNGWSLKSGYAVYPMRYAGTNNRVHYVMTYLISDKQDYGTQQFDISYKVTNNCWVLYNVNNRTLSIFDSRARIVTDPYVYYKSNTATGVFNRRYYTYNLNGYNKSNILKAIIGYIPYAGAVSNLYDQLTSTSATTTNKWYPYGDSYNIQKNERYIVREVKAYGRGLKEKYDYILLKLEGDGIRNISWGFNADFYDPTWY